MLDRRIARSAVILATCAISATGFAQVQARPMPRQMSPGAPPQGTGWPHTVLTGTRTNCARDPGPNEVMVYRDSSFAGACAVLTAGFYPHAENLLVGNDSISSIKVGSGVRARVFKDQVYAGAWNIYAPGSRDGGLGSGWNDEISSMRIEPANRSEQCSDVMEEEIAVFRDSSMRGDCVVLPGAGQWENAEAMGIANDSISSVVNKSSHTFYGYGDSNFQMSSNMAMVKPHTSAATLPTISGGAGDNVQNDTISSIMMK